MKNTEFLDIIWTGSGYVKRFRHYFSGKMEIIEETSSYEAYKMFIHK